MQPLAPLLRLLLLGLLLSLTSPAWAQVLPVNALPAEHAGRYTQVLKESTSALTVEQASRLFQQGQGRAGQTPILNFGIGSPPVWLRLQLHNPTDQPISVQVITGTSWIDDLQLTLVQDGKPQQQWQSGDAQRGAKDLVPGIGYVVPLRVPSGSSELYLRAQSPDPLILPIEVLSESSFLARDREYKFVYGLIYGFLLSLIVYNSMLFIGLRERSYLYYSIYLGLFALLNFAYSGHGFAWVWSDNPLLQGHIILLCMLLFGCSGLLFTSSFLPATCATRTARLKPCRTWRHWHGHHPVARRPHQRSVTAFGFSLLAAISMVVLGLTTLGTASSRALLPTATLCGMLGTAISILTVWGATAFYGWNYAPSRSASFSTTLCPRTS
ncbi:MAG: 7TM-DISM domain-containing protein [Pseudomonas sp.]|nr:7TM-DISM domain-containing protein [Pseudomonas sp.]